MENVSIETPRFILRSLTEEDATERYLGWMIDTVANRFIVSARDTLSVADLRAFIAARIHRTDVLFLGIFFRDDGSHIGNIKYEPIRPAEGYAVMGLLVGDPNWRGKGVAGEVLAASINWLQEKFCLEEILLGVDRNNEAALRAYRSFGFRTLENDRLGISSAQNMAMVFRLGTGL